MSAAAGQARTHRAFSEAVRLLQTGRLEAAGKAVDAILGRQPDNFEATHLKGVILFQAGRREEAVKLFEAALGLRPSSAQVLSDLGMVLVGLGRSREAQSLLERAVELAPDMAAAHLNLGNARRALGSHHRAEGHYRKALELQPDFGAALNNLSGILLGMGRAAESAELAERLIAIAPKSPAGYSRLGAACDRLGRLAEAIEAHERAVTLNPANTDTRLSYATSLAGYGQMQQAAAQCREAIARDPDSAAAHTQLASVIRLSEDPGEMARMEALMARADLGPTDRGGLGFALGRAREQLKDYEAAFETFAAANALIAGEIDYSVAGNNDLTDDAIAAFGAGALEKFRGGGVADDTPIFIVGMPRSGTTLTEQILCSHPDVFGAGEPAIMRWLTNRACDEHGVTTFKGLTEAIDEKGLAGIGRDYVETLSQYSPGARHIVDKVPANFLFVGLIHLCLPNAKIVHCRRNPADTCLSIFKNRFAAGNLTFAYDLDHLAGYYAAYRRLMAHWHEVLPGVVHDIDYEALVADQLAESQKLFAHCGLDWTDDALRFHETARPVHTASVAQVRQPIYAGSSGLVARYGAAARPLIEALERAGVDPAGGAAAS